jgi:hypothetical protein
MVSYSRLGTCATAAAGPRCGRSGMQLGQADRTGACSKAAGRCLRHKHTGQLSLARLENHQGTGHALTGLAPQWARAVYDLLT